MHRFLLAGLLAFVPACSWVAVEPGAEDVLVLPAERLTAQCKSLGSVTVSVLEKVAVLERHDEEVIQDLNVLARNHAAKTGGDTVVARGPVEDGARRYEVFRCTPANARPGQDEPVNQRQDEKVEVLPYDRGSNQD